MGLKKWSAAEDQHLRDYSASRAAQQLASDLNRPIEGVRSRLRHLGLKAFRSEDRVTPALEDAIKGGHASAWSLSRQFHLSIDRVRQAASRLGTQLSTVEHWTPEQDAILRAQAAQGTLAVSAATGKSRYAVLARALRLHVSIARVANRPIDPDREYKCRPWSAEEDSQLRALAPEKLPGEIAETIGRSRSAVAHRAKSLRVALISRGPGRPRAKADRLGRPQVERKAHARRVMPEYTGPQIEWCHCGAPVSNWDQHYERTGHPRPLPPGWIPPPLPHLICSATA